MKSKAAILDLEVDTDGDGVIDAEENCLGTQNPDQENADEDAHGDACDDCKCVANDDQADRDSDAAGDACDIGDHGSLTSDIGDYRSLNGLCIVGPNPLVPQADVICLPGVGLVCF